MTDPYAVAMGRALELARIAGGHGDVPVGAVVLGSGGETLAEAANERERSGDPMAHAEVLALRAAATSLGSWRLDQCTLVVTLEPCAMCAGALMQARIGRVVLGAWDERAGACGSIWDIVRDRRAVHRVDVVAGVREQECAALLTDFFAERRTR